MEHDTSDEDSLIPDKDINEESWTFMENPVYDINKEENNELETFDGFVDSPVYGISKGENMELVALENLIWKRSMQYIHMISLIHISLSVMKTKRT